MPLPQRELQACIADVPARVDLELKCRYENGKFLHKKNTFTDFITVAEHLVAEGLAKPERLCMEVRAPGAAVVDKLRQKPSG